MEEEESHNGSGSGGGSATTALSVEGAMPLLALLLPAPDDQPQPAAQPAAAMPPSPLSITLHSIREAVIASVASASTSGVSNVTAMLGGVALPMVEEARGHGKVELIDVRALHRLLVAKSGGTCDCTHEHTHTPLHPTPPPPAHTHSLAHTTHTERRSI